MFLKALIPFSAPGGSHWSLLIFSKQAKEFFHFDSSPGSNAHDAKALARKMHEYFKTKIGDFSFVMVSLAYLRHFDESVLSYSTYFYRSMCLS
jgi:hypothetical protein